ncbi:MAG TPA: cation transporter [Mycobacterium sp.]|nr:cation transporter [Mycobacterium sp.]
MGTTTTATRAYAVTGMTCSHCVAAVSEELYALPGVTKVNVDLVAGGISTVTVSADTPLTPDQVAAALDEAGDYRLTAERQPR